MPILLVSGDTAGMTPALSIITICYDNPAELDLTLDGLTELDPALVEVVVIDGSPNDSCVPIAAKHPAFRYVKERDHGKFDAMNRGLRAAKGDSVLFMNSGDTLHSAALLTEIVRQHRSELSCTIIYGDCIRAVGGRYFRVPAPPIDKDALRRGVFPSHQSVLIPAAYHRDHPYDDGMEFAADSKFLKKAFVDLPHAYARQPIGTFAYGGVSTAARSWPLLRQQYLELCEVGDFGPFERLTLAFTLVRRKILQALLGSAGLERLQAYRVRRSVEQPT